MKVGSNQCLEFFLGKTFDYSRVWFLKIFRDKVIVVMRFLLKKRNGTYFDYRCTMYR
jgi:hypothetical protein